MAIHHSCDGCGVTVETPIKVGKVIERDYCVTCEARANAFIAAEEALRKETQRAFVEARAKLIESYADIKLPDVP